MTRAVALLPPQLQRMRRIVSEEMGDFSARLFLLHQACRLIPPLAGDALRTSLFRRAGFAIGSESVVRGWPSITGGRAAFAHLQVGRRCVIEPGCTMDLEQGITLEDDVVVGPQAMLLTSSHEIGPREQRAGAVVRCPVRIERGAWLGARCIILPGVTVGAGAVVAPGALVNMNVPPHTRVGGSPAKVLEALI